MREHNAANAKGAAKMTGHVRALAPRTVGAPVLVAGRVRAGKEVVLGGRDGVKRCIESVEAERR